MLNAATLSVRMSPVVKSGAVPGNAALANLIVVPLCPKAMDSSTLLNWIEDEEDCVILERETNSLVILARAACAFPATATLFLANRYPLTADEIPMPAMAAIIPTSRSVTTISMSVNPDSFFIPISSNRNQRLILLRKQSRNSLCVCRISNFYL